MKKAICLLLALPVLWGAAPAKAGETPKTAGLRASYLAVAPAESLPTGTALMDFKLTIQQAEIQLPCTFQQLVSLGWQPQYAPGETLAPKSQGRIKGSWPGVTPPVSVLLLNAGEVELPLEECAAVGLLLEEGTPLALPGGLGLGADAQAVQAAYGPPGRQIPGEDGFSYRYGRGKNAWWRLDFKEGAALQRVEVCCYGPPAQVSLEELAAQMQVQPAPAELTTNWQDFIVQYGGALYRLPVSAAQLLQNGWFFEDDFTTPIAPGQWVTGVRLRKGDSVLWARLRNNSDQEQPLYRCDVLTLRYNEQGCPVPLVLAGGVNAATTPAELEMAYGPPARIDAGRQYETWVYGQPGAQMEFSYHKDEGRFVEIKVERDW